MSVSAISGPSAVQSTTLAGALQKATLARLLASCTSDLQNGQSASRVQFLAQQIAALAQALGQTVELPAATATSAPPSSPVSAVTAVDPAEMTRLPPGYA